MINRQYVIFGFPRSGTKLLADVLTQNGFHNYGEFFDTFSSKVENNRAIRKNRDEQYAISEEFHERTEHEIYLKHNSLIEERIIQFNKINAESSTVTVWPENFHFYPGLYHFLKTRHFLCTRRKNKFDQLLSRCLTYTHKNYNSEIESPVTEIDKEIFTRFYHQLHRIEKYQDNIVNSGIGEFIDFDTLISSNNILGYNYSISTKDEHRDLESSVLNINEILDCYSKLSQDGSTV